MPCHGARIRRRLCLDQLQLVGVGGHTLAQEDRGRAALEFQLQQHQQRVKKDLARTRLSARSKTLKENKRENAGACFFGENGGRGKGRTRAGNTEVTGSDSQKID